jgi:hypothetical protein
MTMARPISRASPTKSRRGRPPDPRLIALDEALFEIVRAQKPIGVRGTFYRAEVAGLVSKFESEVSKVGRRLLKLRREGRIPYSWIVDESRDVYGDDSYDGLSNLADDAAQLYRRDYWRNARTWIQVWIEKRGLTGVLSPVVVKKWGLNLYACGGQPSETYLYRGGLDIKNRGVETHIYVLSDFDPAGDTIFNTLLHGSKKAPGGLKRFTGDIPIHIHKLALSVDQVQEWKLPTRPAIKKEGNEKSEAYSREFVDKHGNRAVDLDALAPADLRALVDEAIAEHMPPRRLHLLKVIEKQEQEYLKDRIREAGESWDPIADWSLSEADEEEP